MEEDYAMQWIFIGPYFGLYCSAMRFDFDSAPVLFKSCDVKSIESMRNYFLDDNTHLNTPFAPNNNMPPYCSQESKK